VLCNFLDCSPTIISVFDSAGANPIPQKTSRRTSDSSFPFGGSNQLRSSLRDGVVREAIDDVPCFWEGWEKSPARRFGLIEDVVEPRYDFRLVQENSDLQEHLSFLVHTNASKFLSCTFGPVYPDLARIYTRTGDKGETGLLGGVRVAKDSLRVEAYGDVDELNSVLGMARAFLKDKELDSLLESLQKGLFVAGADLASSREGQREVPRITQHEIDEMERTIDKLQEELPPLKAFIHPGGGQAGAILHFSRTVARRAERRIITLGKVEKVNDFMVPYINRLSDLLFVLARTANHREGKAEMPWHPT